MLLVIPSLAVFHITLYVENPLEIIKNPLLSLK